MGAGAAGTTWAPGTRSVDVLILTAIQPELDAVLDVDDGAVPGTAWEMAAGPSGLPVAFRSFVGQGGRPLRVAVAVAPAMGATAATNTLLPLVEALRPRCVAMCGVCAGRRGKTRLGDVVAADRLYYHDTGKELPDEIQQDLMTFNLRDDWKAALAGLDVVAHFREAEWFQKRPLTAEWRERRALVALRDGEPEPWNEVDPALEEQEWGPIVAALRRRELLAETGRALTEAGRRLVDDLLFEHRDKLPDLSPAGKVEPFQFHVAPMGTGTRVIEDEQIWSFVSQAMRKTLGLEMESAAIGELAHRQRQYKLDAIVMKGVMDFADHGRDDHFKEFAARASAECLLWFLRERIPTEIEPGFDDLLGPGTAPLPDRTAAPSLLLNARHVVVPWYEAGRTEILADLDAWADDPERPVAVRLLHGEGGMGKTRLAIEWVRRRRARHEVAGFLRQDPGEAWLERLCGLGPPVLVVIDYAESRTDLLTLLGRVSAFGAATGPRRRVRVLLLARGDGEWWAALVQHDPILRALVEARAPIELAPLAMMPAAREAVFAAAAMTFAAVRQQAPISRSPISRPPISLDDPRFDRVLYLHMAALAAVERAREAAEGAVGDTVASTAADAGSLMDEILAHEERFWASEDKDRVSAALDVSLARRLVAGATLRGGLAEAEAGQLCERLKDRPQTDEDDRLIKLLHDIYEHVDRSKYVPGLEPDLLGEAMVLRVAAPPHGAGPPAGDAWIERVIVSGDDPQAITTAFTVLGRASATSPAAAGPWIETLLQRELPARAVLALRASKIAGQRTAVSTLGDLLAAALERDGSAEIALLLDVEQIPYPTVALRRVAEWQSRTLLAHAPDGDDDASLAARAALLNSRGVDLSALGQREPALVATLEAVDHYRALAQRNPNAFLPDLAMSLNNLGNRLSELGQHEAALAATREAIEHYRVLAQRNLYASLPDLAPGLNNLGLRLIALGQREAALAATREAVAHYRVLAQHNPDAFLPDLARSLNNLGNILSDLGQHEPALVATGETVAHYRALVQRNPDAFFPDLTGSLNNLGNILSDLGQHEPALAATREAVAYYRALTQRNPDAFRHHLATSLNNLGDTLSALGQREFALAATREAVDLRRALAQRNRDAFLPDLAMSLNNLGLMLSALGQRESALAATREAVDLRRALAQRNRDAFLPDLAMSLNNLGHTLSDLDQRESALAATREAVNLYRELAQRNPDRFLPALARSLNNLGATLSALGQREAALAATRKAVDLYRELAQRNPDAFLPDLATSLNNLGGMLSALGQREPALAATQEAVDHCRALAQRNPDAFLPDLAMSLNNLGGWLGVLGQREPALAAAREAVELYRSLAARYPDAFQSYLTGSLANLELLSGT